MFKLLLIAATLLFLSTWMAFTEEWRPRHALVPPTGVMNLTVPAGPLEVLLAGPDNPSDRAGWLDRIQGWRSDRLTRLRYTGSEYTRPELNWTRRVFSQNQMLIWDRTFYDPARRQYTVDRYLTELQARLGSIDAVLIWHVYPNVGADDRNQLDLLRDVPGGLPALRDVVNQFHDRNIKVFFPTLAWETGTRDEGVPLWDALARLLKDVGADGINFDTLETVPLQFRTASEAAAHPLALEPQFDTRDESIAWSTLGWSDWVTWEDIPYPFVPMVSQSKWLEPRRMLNVTDRFTRDKTNSLQHAFFNGVGYATMENLWGFWYGMTPRDAEALLRITRIERALPDLVVSSAWEPHAPTVSEGVFSSRFPGAAQTLWTFVNRNEYAVSGPQLRVAHRSGTHYFDLWHGVELPPLVVGNEATLTFSMEGLGFGAVLATDQSPPGRPLKDLLAFLAERSVRPLGAYSKEWRPVPQSMVDMPPTTPAVAAPEGMARIAGGDYEFVVRGIEIEGANDPGVDVQYPWEDAPRRFHRRALRIPAFYIDRTPVTNVQFSRFIEATAYHPDDDHNFLRDWKGGRYPEGWANKPVTWVSIEDARAYASWAGKRLPHDWEWQYAAQSADGRLYPWGSEWDAERVPAPDHGRTMRPATNVDAFPSGASPFGVLDLQGNVSQWTDEFQDEHTRAAVVRGGAYYQPRGSIWYFPQTYRLDEHQKYLLMSPGRDRAGTIGFRCVVDAQQQDGHVRP